MILIYNIKKRESDIHIYQEMQFFFYKELEKGLITPLFLSILLRRGKIIYINKEMQFFIYKELEKGLITPLYAKLVRSFSLFPMQMHELS